MTISSLGSGSGLDLSGILNKLMQVEQQPLLALQTKEASYQSRISALGTLKGSLSSLQSAASAFIPGTGESASNKFATLKASVADTSIVTASATTGASAASYALTNITLAKEEQIRKSGITIPALDGTLSITVGSGATVDVAVTADSTLSDVVKAINDSSADVSASIVNNGTSDFLILSANKAGQTNQITVTSSDPLWNGFDFTPPGASTPGYVNNGWTEQQEATTASVNINGLLVTSETNTISSAISGVTLNLVKESVAGTTLTVTKDTTAGLTSAINGFIKAYNDAAKSMKDLGLYNTTSKQAGALQGDSTLRNAQSQVRNLMQSKAGGGSVYQMLADIGVALQKDGTLKLDTSKLTKAVEADYEGVTTLVSSVGTAFKNGLEGLVGTSGNIAAATDSANLSIKNLVKSQAALSDRLTKVEARYRKQFTALDTMLASMNSTSSFLAQQLASLG
ncbi:MAG: flagellar filament capping protein FliD [Dechloromonas sp.]|nr:flagellar filament capping protein FliD [Dechloromonas sp.]